MVEIKNIEKSFGKLNVLKGINININKGQIIAILGPNGSGKTTLIKSILGLVIPQKGEILINGKNIKHNESYRKDIGYLSQIAKFPENLNVKELFKMIEDIRGEKGNTEVLIDFFAMQPHLNKPLRSLSGGTKQKVNVILSLMFNSELYIFDEPTVGLDPISRVKFKEWVKKEKQNGKTAILSTHLLSEVEELADEIIFILEGKIYYQGSPQELKIKYNEPTLERAIAKMLEQYNHNV